MTTLVSDAIALSRRDLYSLHRPQLNRLTADIASGSTSLQVDFDIGGLAANTYIGIEDEIVYVWDSDPDTKAATIMRGQQGTAAAAHVAGTLLEVNPRFPSASVRQALLDEIRSWPDTLFATYSFTGSLAAGKRGMDILNAATNGFLDILEVLRVPSSSSASALTTDSYIDEMGWRIARNLSDAAYPSGYELILNTPASIASSYRVTYSYPFNLASFIDSVDLVATVGLSLDMLDIPRWGAQWRLLAPLETKRTDVSGATSARVAADVPAGFSIRTAAQIKSIRDQRIKEEADRLRLKFPRWKMRVSL